VRRHDSARSDATSASDGRQAPPRLLHYDLTGGSFSVRAIADRLPAAANVRALLAALAGSVTALAEGLLLGAREHGDGALLQVTLYCGQCDHGLVGALLARRTTDQTMAAWRQLRDQAPVLVRDHVMPASLPVAPWIISELLPDHETCAPWLQDTVRELARTWLSLN
jgi:hypothetical protein